MSTNCENTLECGLIKAINKNETIINEFYSKAKAAKELGLKEVSTLFSQSALELEKNQNILECLKEIVVDGTSQREIMFDLEIIDKEDK